MSVPIIRPALAAAAALTIAGCSSYDNGRGYGYSSASIGYSSNGYRDRYYGGRGSYYGDGYADSGYYGWSGDYYYPGVGFYLYDRSGTRHRWSDDQRRYWEGRAGRNHDRRENWSGYQYRHDNGRRDDRRDRRRHR